MNFQKFTFEDLSVIHSQSYHI